MKNYPTEIKDALKGFYTFIRRTVYIKIIYLLITIFINIFFLPIPRIIFITVSSMIVYSLAIFFLVRKRVISPESIINILFLLSLLDIILITIIINFLGIALYIFYSFYIILGFMVLPRNKSFYLVGWITFLYLSLILLQHFRIFSPIQFFTPTETNPYNSSFVSSMTIVYLGTLLFLSFRCYDFYQLIDRRIDDLQNTQLVLEEEKNSLEIRIGAKKKQLKEEKGKLEEKVERRKIELEQENKKLEEKAEELTKFQKVTQGRDLKIKELKEKLANLKSAQVVKPI